MRTTQGALCLAMLLAGRSAAANEFILHIEPTASFWVDQPQTDRFTPGAYVAIRPGVALGPVVSLQWSYALLVTPAGEGFTEVGSAQSVLAGLRLRPFGARRPDSEQLAGLWVDGNLGYVRTEGLDRFGFDAGLGYNWQIASGFALGPVLRYGQIVQPDDIPNRDPNDAQFVNVGLGLSFGSTRDAAAPAVASEPCPACPAEKACPAIPECVQQVAICADRDGDGVCDVNDRCPTTVGPLATFGCPIDPCSGKPLSILVQFDYDSAKMPVLLANDPQTMDPVLDAVAAAIAQDRSCRVCIVGYASEEGSADYNLDLSRRRAAAVEGYLSAHGLAGRRMPTTGLGAACQLVPESSRVLNRRVEFRRLQDGESCPVDCTE